MGFARAYFEFFEAEFELRDLGVQLLGGAAELHPPQPRQLHLQLLDLEAARQQARPLLDDDLL